MCGSAVAQDETTIETAEVVVGATELLTDGDQDGEPQVMRSMSVFASEDGSPPVILSSNSFGGIDGPMNFSFGGGGGEVDSFSLLSNPSVQKDLELVDDQVKQIQAIQRDFGKQISEQLKGGFSGDRAQELGKIIRELKDKQKEQINNILLDHQQDRLKQVAMQTQLKNGGTANALGNKNFVEALGLTEKQIARLKDRSKELQKEMQEKIKKMRSQMKEELLGELSVEQRNKLKELLGDKYESKSEDWRSSFRNRMKSVREKKSNGD